MTNDTNAGARLPAEDAISVEALAALGAGQVAYLKSMDTEELKRAFPNAPELAPGLQFFALFAANGAPILLTDDRDTALQNAREHELVTVSLH